MTGEDALKYILLGASTVQVLSVIMVNGWGSMGQMNADIAAYLERKGVGSIESIRGKALANLTPPDQIIRWSGEPLDGSRNVRKF